MGSRAWALLPSLRRSSRGGRQACATVLMSLQTQSCSECGRRGLSLPVYHVLYARAPHFHTSVCEEGLSTSQKLTLGQGEVASL